MDLLSFYVFIGQAQKEALTDGFVISPVVGFLAEPTIRLTLCAAGLMAILFFARRPGRIGAGSAALVSLGILSTVHAHLFGSPWRHLFYGGLCLTGWLAGLVVTRRHGGETDESYAVYGAIALLGTAYLNAGISKLAYGGLDWLSGLPIQAVVIAQDGLVADDMTSSLRSWLVSTPIAASALCVGTVLFELAGPLMLIGQRIRIIVAGGLIAMHSVILLLTGILYWESMLFLGTAAAFGDLPRSSVSGTRPILRRRWFSPAVVLLILCGALAIRHQAIRHESLVASQTSTQPPPRSEPTPRLEQIGPFSVGQDLGDGWKIASLDRTVNSVVVGVQGAPGVSRFEITCRETSDSSPFDLGKAHLFYSRDLEFDEIREVGQTLRARLEEVSENDVCATISRWLAR